MDPAAAAALAAHPELDARQVAGALATLRFGEKMARRYSDLAAPALDPGSVRAKVGELYRREAVGV